MTPKQLDIVIPMAGHGSRFANVGYKLPKPLIDVEGLPMIQRVIENLKPNLSHRFIFVARHEHIVEHGLIEKLKRWAGPQTECISLDKVTEGAACTVLLAKPFLSSDRDLVIANSDQLVDFSMTDFISFSRGDRIDGTILVFEDRHEKWSFARLNPQGEIVEVAEKKPISNLATVGVYYFRRGMDFVEGAERMIRKNLRVNNEFYVCPVYNELIHDGRRLLPHKITREQMHGLGTPEDLELYLKRRV